MKKIFFYLVIGLIFLLSFYYYSSLFYPILNSDNAVTILMIHSFNLPSDLYFWGQDRMGSLIPLIGQIPFKLFNFSALASEAITHYLILLLGFLAFSSLLKSYFYKIILAFIWFLPPIRLIDGIQLYSGIEYSLIAISCYLFNLSDKENIQKKIFLHHFILLLITLILIASIWVSDMALMSVFLLIVIQLFYYLRKNKLTKLAFKNPKLYYALIGILIGYIFIHYAKSISSNRQDYTTFSDINTILQSIIIFYNTIADIFLFRATEPFTSIYAYMVIIIIGFSFFVLRKIKINGSTKKWAVFFLADAIVVFVVIIISQWTFLSNVPRRYFTCTYIAFSFFLLLLFDNLVLANKHNYFLKIFIFLTVFIGGAGTIYNLKYIWPKTLKPKIEIVDEFKKLGKIGIISEYWNSYITSCPNPDLIIATPNEQSYVRNKKITDEVFRQKKLYVIKDMWLESFPDTLKQFGHILLKDGKPFNIGDCNVCKYKKIK
jgi:hypothetical protein